VVIRLKVPIEMHYTVIPMGTSKVNSSPVVLITSAITKDNLNVFSSVDLKSVKYNFKNSD